LLTKLDEMTTRLPRNTDPQLLHFLECIFDVYGPSKSVFKIRVIRGPGERLQRLRTNSKKPFAIDHGVMRAKCKKTLLIVRDPEQLKRRLAKRI